MTTLAQDAVTETFVDVERLLYDLAHKFQRQYYGDFDELVSIGYDAFMRAYAGYNPDRSRFVTWFRYVVWKAMLEDMRTAARRNGILTQVQRELDSITSPERQPFADFLDELTTDARTVVDLIFNDSEDTMKNTSPRSRFKTKQALRSFLKNLGWSANRITESFREIEEALS